MDQISTLTLLEAAELVDQLKVNLSSERTRPYTVQPELTFEFSSVRFRPAPSPS